MPSLAQIDYLQSSRWVFKVYCLLRQIQLGCVAPYKLLCATVIGSRDFFQGRHVERDVRSSRRMPASYIAAFLIFQNCGLNNALHPLLSFLDIDSLVHHPIAGPFQILPPLTQMKPKSFISSLSSVIFQK